MPDQFTKEPTDALGARSDTEAPATDSPRVRCENERCGAVLDAVEFAQKLKVCPRCDYHARLTARERVEQLADPGSFVEHDANLLNSAAPRQVNAETSGEVRERRGEPERALAGTVRIEEQAAELVMMDASYLDGIVGETFVRAADRALAHGTALIAVSAWGRAQQPQGTAALLQTARVVSAVANLGRAGVPFIVVLTDPTRDGVLASFAAVGDVIIGEPADMETFELPLEHGIVDMVLHRRNLRPTLARLLSLYASAPGPSLSAALARAAQASGDTAR